LAEIRSAELLAQSARHHHGKRCGVTENIGAAARRRWKESSDHSKREAA
jgi:hypothetical protein